MAGKTYQTDDAGSIIDPPIIGTHEKAIVDAQAAGDDNLVHALHQEYHEHRAKIVDTIERDDDNGDGENGNGDINWGENPVTADALATNNSYDALRNAARTRDLPTGGGKRDLAERLADWHADHGNDTDTED